MTNSKKEPQSMKDIFDQYVSAAIEFGVAQRIPDYKAGNKFATKLERLGGTLRRSDEGQELLVTLLNHDDTYVVLWAAKDCLFFSPDKASSVLEQVEKTPGLVGTTARITLAEWRAGRLF